MMNIREYFEMVRETEGYDTMEELQDTMYELYDAFVTECEVRGIDLKATETLLTLKVTETVLTLWIWDMCEE